MISKKISTLLVISTLALVACGKQNTAIETTVDLAKSESVAQNLQQAMMESMSAAEMTVSAENMTSSEPEAIEGLNEKDMQGTWLMVGGEIEGDVWEAIPGNYEILSISLEPNPADGTEMLFADMEARDYEGIINKSFYQQKIESLDEPLYDGCGNEAWSVRFGDESEKNENGYPIHEEYYATLLDRNTLLMQQFFTFDGGPGVSYQTFKRVFPGEDVFWRACRHRYRRRVGETARGFHATADQIYGGKKSQNHPVKDEKRTAFRQSFFCFTGLVPPPT